MFCEQPNSKTLHDAVRSSGVLSWALLPFALLLFVSGCSSLYVHDPQVAKSTKEAQEAWQLADPLKGAFPAQREFITQLATRKAVLRAQNVLATRDEYLTMLIDEPVDEVVARDLEEVSGDAASKSSRDHLQELIEFRSERLLGNKDAISGDLETFNHSSRDLLSIRQRLEFYVRRIERQTNEFGSTGGLPKQPCNVQTGVFNAEGFVQPDDNATKAAGRLKRICKRLRQYLGQLDETLRTLYGFTTVTADNATVKDAIADWEDEKHVLRRVTHRAWRLEQLVKAEQQIEQKAGAQLKALRNDYKCALKAQGGALAVTRIQQAGTLLVDFLAFLQDPKLPEPSEGIAPVGAGTEAVSSGVEPVKDKDDDGCEAAKEIRSLEELLQDNAEELETVREALGIAEELGLPTEILKAAPQTVAAEFLQGELGSLLKAVTDPDESTADGVRDTKVTVALQAVKAISRLGQLAALGDDTSQFLSPEAILVSIAYQKQIAGQAAAKRQFLTRMRDLATAKFDSYLSELIHLSWSRHGLNGLDDALQDDQCADPEKDNSFAEIMVACKDDVVPRKFAAQALKGYADSWTHGRLQQQLVEISTDEAIREFHLAREENNWRAWHGLLSPPIELLVAYGDGGIDPELFTRIASLFALISTAVGANM